MKLKTISKARLSVAVLLAGCLSAAHADSLPGDHELTLNSDDIQSAGSHDYELSKMYVPGSSNTFTESFSLFVDKLLRVSATITENTAIDTFTSVGLFADNTLVANGVIEGGDNATASLVVADLLPGSYEIRVSGILNNDVRAGRFDVSADAVATPIPTAAWFFGPVIAAVFGIRSRRSKGLQPC